MSCVRLTRPDRAIISVLLTSVSWLHASLWRERGGGGSKHINTIYQWAILQNVYYRMYINSRITSGMHAHKCSQRRLATA